MSNDIKNNIDMNKRETFMVLINDVHEYDIITTIDDDSDNTVYELFASNSNIWNDHIKSTKLIGIINDDFDYEIHNIDDKGKEKIDDVIKLDVSKMQELRILLNFIAKNYDIGIKIINTTETYKFGKFEK